MISLKCVYYEDLKKSHIKGLSRGTYIINDERQELYGDYVYNYLEFDGIPKISRVRVTKEKTGYTDGTQTISVDEFQEKELEVIKHLERDEDGDIIYGNLENEFAHRKFLQQWKPVFEEHEEIVPLQFDVVYSCFDTGNEFIRPMADGFNGSPEIFIYSRKEALVDYFKKKVEEEIEKGNINKYEIPNIGLGYAKIDGSSVFKSSTFYNHGKRYEFPRKGKLKDMLECAKEDQKFIDESIQAVIGKHKCIPNEFPVKEFEDNLWKLSGRLQDVDPKQKTVEDYRSANNLLNKIITDLNNWYRTFAEKK